MELNKELISSIASNYGLSAEDLTAKLTSNEPQDLKLAGELFTEQELKARDSGKFNEGKTMMSERIAKDFKQKYGYELDGVKDFEKVLEHHEAQLKTKFSKNGNERVTELESDLQKMKSTYENELEELKAANSQFETKYKQQNLKNTLLANMPKDTVLKAEDIITLYNSKREIDFVNDIPVLKKDGEILKDAKTTEPISLVGDFNNWLVEEKFLGTPSGRGGSDEYGKTKFGGAKTPEQFQAKWQESNPDKSINSPEYQNAYAEFRTEQKNAS